MAQPDRRDRQVRQARKDQQAYPEQLEQPEQLARLARAVPVDLLERPEHRDLPGQTAPVSFFWMLTTHMQRTRLTMW
jgi:hypothetical protein